MDTKIFLCTNQTMEHVFSIFFENSKTFKIFSKEFNLYCKYNAKPNPYFVSIMLAKMNPSFCLTV